MTRRGVLLNRPIPIGSAANAAFLRPVEQRVAGQRSESHAPSLAGREIQAVLQGLSNPKRIGLEVKRPCIRMRDRHVTD